jgi:hypothetical protein
MILGRKSCDAENNPRDFCFFCFEHESRRLNLLNKIFLQPRLYLFSATKINLERIICQKDLEKTPGFFDFALGRKDLQQVLLPIWVEKIFLASGMSGYPIKSADPIQGVRREAMPLQAIYYTEMAMVSLEYYVDTNNPFYLDVASDFLAIAFEWAPEA